MLVLLEFFISSVTNFIGGFLGMLCNRKMFNLFLSKNVRKILKRKHSDAGEEGTILLGSCVYVAASAAAG